MPKHGLVEIEQRLLGSLIQQPVLLDDIGLQDEHFSQTNLRLIFNALREMSEASLPIDALSLAEHLEQREQLDRVGGLPFLGGLALAALTAESNIRHYAQIAIQRHANKKIARGGEDIFHVLNGHQSAGEKLVAAEGILDALADKTTSHQTQSMMELLPMAIGNIEHRYSNQGQPPAYPFGLDDLDDKTCGAEPGDLIIIAGRPSMGKTAFAMNTVELLCSQHGKKGLVMSAEMPGVQLVSRMISSAGRIDAQRLRKGDIQDDDWDKITVAATKINEMQLCIDEKASPTLFDVKAAARRAHRKMGGLDFIVIDYLQLMSGGSKSDNRTNEISDISRGLKGLAKEMGVPVYALSQLNRSLEQRANKRPVMSDLRESGAIEQDADLILFLYRDEVYDKNSPDKGLAEIIIGKQRNGPIGTCRAAFIGQFARFENVRGTWN